VTEAYDRDEEAWSEFTGRPRPPVELEATAKIVEGRRVLVTGAGGSIGSALARALATIDVEELVLLDQAEAGLHELGGEPALGALGDRAKFVVGSIGDEALLGEVFGREAPEIVFHAAACKHVPLMEANPFTAASTNVLGTWRLVRAAAGAGVRQCVLLSTDKAVEPSSIMGATKRVAELILLAAPGETVWKAVRLGNVFGSSGSVVATFQEQVRRGGPVTVTHADASRYFLPMSAAVRCLLAALADELPTGIFVPDVGEPHRILNLARFFVDAEGTGSPPIEITLTGLRPGDKLSERMVAGGESIAAEAKAGLRLVRSDGAARTALDRCLRDVEVAVKGRDLDGLLRALEGAVPGYRPSAVLQRARRMSREGATA